MSWPWLIGAFVAGGVSGFGLMIVIIVAVESLRERRHRRSLA